MYSLKTSAIEWLTNPVQTSTQSTKIQVKLVLNPEHSYNNALCVFVCSREVYITLTLLTLVTSLQRLTAHCGWVLIKFRPHRHFLWHPPLHMVRRTQCLMFVMWVCLRLHMPHNFSLM